MGKNCLFPLVIVNNYYNGHDKLKLQNREKEKKDIGKFSSF